MRKVLCFGFTMLRKVPSLIVLASVYTSLTGCGKDPEVAKREFVRSARFVAQREYAEALIQYRNAVQQDPRFGEARRKLSDMYLATGDIDNAFREVVRAADLPAQ